MQVSEFRLHFSSFSWWFFVIVEVFIAFVVSDAVIVVYHYSPIEVVIPILS